MKSTINKDKNSVEIIPGVENNLIKIILGNERIKLDELKKFLADLEKTLKEEDSKNHNLFLLWDMTQIYAIVPSHLNYILTKVPVLLKITQNVKATSVIVKSGTVRSTLMKISKTIDNNEHIISFVKTNDEAETFFKNNGYIV